LQEAMEKREEITKGFTYAKALLCAMKFDAYLRVRQYNGHLKFDHNNQVLDIVINPSTSDEDSKSKDLKSLSGGERSFSTVAFLLSLWSIVESPILFLDEFDVFMDQINRNLAMDLIVASAKDNLNGQYIFLTPQGIGYSDSL
jgi:chromosome segregation ATPase